MSSQRQHDQRGLITKKIATRDDIPFSSLQGYILCISINGKPPVIFFRFHNPKRYVFKAFLTFLMQFSPFPFTHFCLSPSPSYFKFFPWWPLSDPDDHSILQNIYPCISGLNKMTKYPDYGRNRKPYHKQLIFGDLFFG